MTFLKLQFVKHWFNTLSQIPYTEVLNCQPVKTWKLPKSFKRFLFLLTYLNTDIYCSISITDFFFPPALLPSQSSSNFWFLDQQPYLLSHMRNKQMKTWEYRRVWLGKNSSLELTFCCRLLQKLSVCHSVIAQLNPPGKCCQISCSLSRTHTEIHSLKHRTALFIPPWAISAYHPTWHTNGYLTLSLNRTCSDKIC